MNLTQQNFQTLGFTIVFCLVLIVLFGQVMNSLAGEKGLILKTEFVKTREEFVSLVGDRTEGVKNALLVDTIGFIPVYFLLFALIIWFLGQQVSYGAKYLATAAMVFAVATIFFDFSENLKVFEALKENSAAVSLNIAASAIGKWLCFFVTTAILSVAFWKPHYLTIAIAVLLISGSLIGLAALLTAKHELIQIAILLPILGLAISGISFMLFPETLARIFNSK
jgi:hypothetical protein